MKAKAGATVTVEAVVRDKDGNIKDVETTTAPLLECLYGKELYAEFLRLQAKKKKGVEQQWQQS